MPILGIFSSAVAPVAGYKLVMSVTPGQVYLTTDAITWEWVAPNIVQDYTTVTGSDSRVENLWYLNGQRIARLDPNRALATSTDGITWNLLNCNIATPNKIIWDGTYYVAAEDFDTVAYSTDLITWTYSNFYFNNRINTIAYNSGTYVIMGDFDTCYTSTNLVTWTSRTTGATTDVNWNDVTYGNKWVAVGYDTAAGLGRIRTSTDGISWDSRNPSATGASEAPEFIYWNGSRYVVATDVVGTQSSTDGITWANGTGLGSFITGANQVTYGNNTWVFVAAAGGVIATSTNGTSWTDASTTGGSGWDGSCYTVIYDGSKWIFGADVGSNQYNYWTSTNLTTFTGQGYLQYRKPTLNDLIWDGTQYVVVGISGYLAVSTDAISWTSRTSTFGTSTISGIFYGNGTYVAVGAGGQLRTSTDTITWTSRTSNFATSNINKGIYANNLYVIVGNAAKVATSTDAITWTTRTADFGTSNIQSIAYGAGVYVISGNSDKISSSTDGITWTSRSDISTLNLGIVRYAVDKFVAVRSSGILASEPNPHNYLTSTDGITWTTRATPSLGDPAYNPALVSLAYSSSLGLWTVAASSNSNWTNAVGNFAYFTSTDAITWTSRTSTKVNPAFNATGIIAL